MMIYAKNELDDLAKHIILSNLINNTIKEGIEYPISNIGGY